MARSAGSALVAAILGALSFLLLAEFAAFVNPGLPSNASSRSLRSRVSLAATQADVDAAEKDFKLKKWAADHLANSGSPAAAGAAARAQQAEATYMALKAQVSGQAPPPVAAMPVAAAPVAAAPVAAAAAVSAVSKEALAAAKQSAQLLTWAANKLAGEGSPQAASMKAKADQAVAAFEALKQAQASGASMPAPVAAAPVAAAPVRVAAAAAPAMPSAGGPSAEEVLKAKKEMELHEWAAQRLASAGSLQAAVMKTKADQSRQTYEALKAMQEKQFMGR